MLPLHHYRIFIKLYQQCQFWHREGWRIVPQSIRPIEAIRIITRNTEIVLLLCISPPRSSREIRTLTVTILSRLPLPLGYRATTDQRKATNLFITSITFTPAMLAITSTGTFTTSTLFPYFRRMPAVVCFTFCMTAITVTASTRI